MTVNSRKYLGVPIDLIGLIVSGSSFSPYLCDIPRILWNNKGHKRDPTYLVYRWFHLVSLVIRHLAYSISGYLHL